MIWPLLFAAHVAVAPVPPVAGPSAHDLLVAARMAIQAKRLAEGTAIVARAVGAGASGPELDRVMADLAFASGRFAEARARYEALLKARPWDKTLLEPAGLSALKLGRTDRAFALLSKAEAAGGAGWRVWNALGVLSDLKSDWARAGQCYDEASRLAPTQAEPVNNRGWSHLLRGEWQMAADYFERAKVLDPNSKRIADNAQLAKDVLAADLPKRGPAESDESIAARLNDAGVAAVILGDQRRAVAAFTHALDASGTWYKRAATNLEAVSRQ
jgi:Flp pilus assembly protein TadD